MKAVTKAFLRYLLRRRSLSALQIMGVACGVAAAVAMELAARSALVSFETAAEFLSGRATHVMERLAGPMDEGVLREVMNHQTVVRFSPVLDRWLRVRDRRLVRVLGIDPLLDRELRTVPIGADQKGRQGIGEAFLANPDAVLLEARLAEELNVASGGELSTSHGVLAVAGTFPNPAGEPLIIMDIAAAQRIFCAPGKIDRIELVLADESAFRMSFRGGFRLQSRQERQRHFTAMVGAFRLNLEAMSLIALFVSVFLIYNTTMFTVVSRRRDAGILLCLGASRREILAAFLAEIAILGLIGGLLGAVIGYLLSFILTDIVGASISNLYFPLRPQPLPWSAGVAAAGVGLGLAASLLGGLVPLADLARTDVVVALSGRVPQRKTAGLAGRAAAAGLAVMGLSAAFHLLGPAHVYASFVVIFGLLVGMSLMTGVLLLWLAPALRRIFGCLAGPAGVLAALSIPRSLGRSAVAVAAFTMALAMSVGIASMIGSFRHSLIWWMDSQLRGDLYISGPGDVGIPPGFYEEVRAVPGVGGVDAYHKTRIDFRGKTAFITAIVAEVLQRYDRFGWVEGDDSHWEAVKRGDVIVSESFARNFRIRPGEMIEIDGIRGPAKLRVEAVFYDYTTEHGVIIMDRATYLGLFEDETIDSVAVFNDPDSPLRRQVVEQIRQMAQARGLPAFLREEFHRNILAVFDSTFAVTRSMRIIAIVIAFFGIAGALITLFIERRRDFGILRALGFSTRQVAVMTLLEAVGMGVVSLLFGAAAGTVLAFFLIKVINLRSFNWTIFFHPQWEPYAAAALTAVLAAAGAALYPIFKVIRTYPHLQIRED